MGNRWGNSGNRDFIFLGSKTTADGDCSHETKMLAPWKISYDKLRQCVEKWRHHSADKVSSSQGYGFSSCGARTWELECEESWAPKNWCLVLELWCCRRLLRVLWTSRRSNQSILKEISPGCSLKGLMLKLKLQYFGHLMRRADSFEKTLMLGRLSAGGEGDYRGWDGCMASLAQWTWILVSLGVGDGQGGVACCSSWGRRELDMTERLNWTELNM